jgi:two-component system, NarL family, response regulator NreC
VPMRLETEVPADSRQGEAIRSPVAGPGVGIGAAGSANGQKLRVLLADDHAVMRDGLARLLQTQPDMEAVGQASDGIQAVEMALHLRPDVVVMDVNMPQLNGMEATYQILSQLPTVRVIGLSMYEEGDVAGAMRQAGAAAYLAKTSPPEALLAAIRAAAAAR